MTVRGNLLLEESEPRDRVDPRSAEPTLLPRIAVVIVTYNGLPLTISCLNSLRASTYPNHTIVVVDNASTDGTAGALARDFPEVHLLPQNENLGFTGGSNLGIDWSLKQSADAVLLLNADAQLDPDALGVMVARLGKADIVAPEVRSLENAHRILDEIAWFDWRLGVAGCRAPRQRDPGGLPSRIASGCCLLVARRVFETVGLLDEEFFLYFEDVDFVVRAQMAGFDLVREPKAVVYHPDASSMEGTAPSALKIYYNTRNRLYLMHKYSRDTARFHAYFLATRAVYGLRYCISGQGAQLMAMLRGMRDFIAGRLARAEYEW